MPHADWNGTQLVLPGEFNGPWRDVLTGRLHEPQHVEDQAWLEVENLFAQFPVALLTSTAIEAPSRITQVIDEHESQDLRFRRAWTD